MQHMLKSLYKNHIRIGCVYKQKARVRLGFLKIMGKTAKKTRSSAKSTSSLSNSTSHITVIVGDPSDHPHCERHGPALLFRETFDDGRPTRQFYGCSANRDRNECRVRERVEQAPAADADDDRARFVAYENRLQRNAALFQDIQSLPATDRAYCGQCGRLVIAADIGEHAQHSGLLRNITDHQLGSPTRLLAPLSNDSREAQYFFADTTLLAIESILRAARIRRIVCIGAPRLHEYVREHSARLGGCASVLLDLDDRLEPFYGRHEFYRFNMFNGWWADGSQRGAEFDEFLRGDGMDGDEGSTLLFTDPPFGCRSEPLAHTLHALQHRQAVVRGRPLPAAPLPIMWVFPYFQASYVQRCMPQLQASAYAVNYTGHRSYRTGPGGRKLGSPVRLFTNVPAALAGRAAVPAAEGYTVCAPCGDRWLAPGAGKHCARCGECVSLNGAAYRHCAACELCVKPSYVHCDPCGRCAPGPGSGAPHNCSLYRRHAQCWICRRRGHVERECVEWLAVAGGGRTVRQDRRQMLVGGRICLVCGRCGHNEKRCIERAERLDEWTFGGQVFNRFVCDKVVE